MADQISFSALFMGEKVKANKNSRQRRQVGAVEGLADFQKRLTSTEILLVAAPFGHRANRRLRLYKENDEVYVWFQKDLSALR